MAAAMANFRACLVVVRMRSVQARRPGTVRAIGPGVWLLEVRIVVVSTFKETRKSVEEGAVTGVGFRDERQRRDGAAATSGPGVARPGGTDSASPSYLGRSLPPSAATAWLVRLAEVRLWAILVGCLCIVASVGLADYRSAQDLSLSIFYVIPAVVTATKGRALGLLVASTASATGLLADVAGRTTPYSSEAVPFWNAIMRLTVIVLVVALVDALLVSARHERQLARRDHLTGLQNSRAFHDSAETELRGLGRTGRPLTLAYIDIDRFKTVNDRLGHAAGDAVLIGTGRILSSAMRDVDTVARIGGDEFMVLLPRPTRLRHRSPSAESIGASSRQQSRTAGMWATASVPSRSPRRRVLSRRWSPMPIGSCTR